MCTVLCIFVPKKSGYVLDTCVRCAHPEGEAAGQPPVPQGGRRLPAAHVHIRLSRFGPQVSHATGNWRNTVGVQGSHPWVKCSGFFWGLTTGASSHQRPQGRACALPLVRRVAWRRQAQPPSSLIPGLQPLHLHLQTGAISPHPRPGVCRGRATTRSCSQDAIDLGVPPSPYVDHSWAPTPLRPWAKHWSPLQGPQTGGWGTDF